MAIVAEYLEQIRSSVEHLIFLMPPNSKLIVEKVFTTDGENTDLDEEIYEALPGEVIPQTVSYYECYMLVQDTDEDSDKLLPLKEGLLLHPELEDITPKQRAEYIEKWLMGSETKPDTRACDYLISDKYEGDEVFVPNRFPIEFCHEDDLTTWQRDDVLYAVPKTEDISFHIVLERTA